MATNMTKKSGSNEKAGLSGCFYISVYKKKFFQKKIWLKQTSSLTSHPVKWATPIDFRRPIDSWYKYQCVMLACGGACVAVGLKHMNLQNSITKTDSNDVPVKSKKLNSNITVLIYK